MHFQKFLECEESGLSSGKEFQADMAAPEKHLFWAKEVFHFEPSVLTPFWQLRLPCPHELATRAEK